LTGKLTLKVKVNNNLEQELLDRAGHYVRSELVQRFQRIEKSGSLEENRYSIPVPITDEQKAMFQRNRTLNHILAEELYELLLKEADGARASFQGASRVTTHLLDTPSNPAGLYIQFKEFREIVKEEFGIVKPHEIKALLKKIQDQNMLSSNDDHRTKEARLGFRITPRDEL
jgi:hypothetical protein